MAFYFAAIMTLLLINFGCNKDTLKTDTSKAGNGFEIYITNDTSFKTAAYDYDSTWQNFQQNSPLPETKVTDADISWYDWDKQQILLNENGKEKFLKCLANEDKSSLGPRFIVTLNGKRLYAGLVIIIFTQMGIRYPILSYDEIGGNQKEKFEKNPILHLTPYLLKSKNDENPETGTVKNPEIYNYFKEIGKLK